MAGQIAYLSVGYQGITTDVVGVLLKL